MSQQELAIKANTLVKNRNTSTFPAATIFNYGTKDSEAMKEIERSLKDKDYLELSSLLVKITDKESFYYLQPSLQRMCRRINGLEYEVKATIHPLAEVEKGEISLERMKTRRHGFYGSIEAICRACATTTMLRVSLHSLDKHFKFEFYEGFALIKRKNLDIEKLKAFLNTNNLFALTVSKKKASRIVETGLVDNEDVLGYFLCKKDKIAKWQG